MKATRLIQLWVDEPSYGLIEKYCQNMEVELSKFIRDGLRSHLITLINDGIVKNDTGIHNNQLLPKPQKGRPRKVKLEDPEPSSKYDPQGDHGIM